MILRALRTPMLTYLLPSEKKREGGDLFGKKKSLKSSTLLSEKELHF